MPYIQYPPLMTFLDYPDNENSAILIFMMGCENNCPHCHNKNFQKYKYLNNNSIEVTVESLYIILKEFSKKFNTDKVVLSGGDPLAPGNIDFTRKFLKVLSKDFNFCIYTGHSIEYVKEHSVSGFKFIKTGKFLPEKKQNPEKTNNYFQLSSTNQEIFDENFIKLSQDGRINFKKED